jgi:hypothetical protein
MGGGQGIARQFGLPATLAGGMATLPTMSASAIAAPDATRKIRVIVDAPFARRFPAGDAAPMPLTLHAPRHRGTPTMADRDTQRSQARAGRHRDGSFPISRQFRCAPLPRWRALTYVAGAAGVWDRQPPSALL